MAVTVRSNYWSSLLLLVTLLFIQKNIKSCSSFIPSAKQRFALPPPPHSPLFASISEDDVTDDPSSFRFPKIDITLPPPPEDTMTMVGDVSSIILFSYVDHFTNMIFASTANTILAERAAAGLLPPSPITDSPAAAEVITTYAPCLSQPGLASVLMVACWILAGYATEAFSYENTVGCRADRTLMVTAQAWGLASILVAWMAIGSDVACGCEVRSAVGGLTVADGGYIFGSLTVLTCWRFMINFISNRGPW